MSLRYTLRRLNEADCTPDNLFKYELVSTKDTGRILFLDLNNNLIDLSAAAANYAITVANTITAKANELENTINLFSDNSKEVLAQAQTYASNASNSAEAAANSVASASSFATAATDKADLAKAWAQSADSPDGLTDTDSSTGKSEKLPAIAYSLA